MRIPVGRLSLVLTLLMAGQAHAQTVTISNDSAPGTTLEVGNVIGIRIYNAAPNSPITYTYNGQGPWYYDDTTSSGDYVLQTQPLTSNYIMDGYEEHWFVNGVELTIVNLDTDNFPSAPRLPNFNIKENYQGGANTNCSTGTYGFTWKWTPVRYTNDSSTLNSTILNSAAASWSAIATSSLALSSGGLDIDVVDASLGSGALAENAPYNMTSNPGFLNKLGLGCIGGACITSAWYYAADVRLDWGQISPFATAWGLSDDTVVANVLRHELGHSLGLPHPDPANTLGRCSETQDIMATSTRVRLSCGVSGPTACTSTKLNNLYPSNPFSCGTTISCNPSASC